jgi:cation transport protein ChaC
VDSQLTFHLWKSTDHRGTPESPGRVVTVIERSFWETLDDPVGTFLDGNSQENTQGINTTQTNKKQKDLESSTTSTVWGAAYHIPAAYAEEVHDYLDDREIDGYTVHYTPFHPVSPPSSSTGTTASTRTSTTVSTPSEEEEEEGVTESHPSIIPPASNSFPPITCMVYIGLPTNPQFLRDPAERNPAAVAKVISGGCGQSGKNPEYLYLLEKALEGLGLGSADGHVTDLVRRVKAVERGDEVEVEERRAEQEAKRPLPVDTFTHPSRPGTEASDEFK